MVKKYLIGLLILLIAQLVNAAPDRHALVIGNASYKNKPLKNTVNDARDVAKALQQLGYELYQGKAHVNLSHEQMDAVLDDFSNGLSRQSIAVVYFAGHGVSVKSQNYLIPTDVTISRESQVKFRSISLSEIVESLEEENSQGLNIVLLDACRNNPFGSSYRSTSRGLKRPASVPSGTFIGLAAGEGQVAADGTGRNGVYTKYLLKSFKESSYLPLEQAYKRIVRGVVQETAQTENPQRPIFQSNIIDDVCFGECGAGEKGEFGHLTVKVAPSNARVQIMNIGPKYEAGIRLKKGRSYDIYVQAEGYQGWRRDIVLKEDDQVVGVVLEKRDPNPTPVVEQSQWFEPEMVSVRGGRFRMGDLSGEGDDDEKPVHEVRIKPFSISKHEVTVEQFKEFVESKDYQTEAERNVGFKGCWVWEEEWKQVEGKSWRDPGFKQGEGHPVVCVSWNDAKAYIDWLNNETSKAYRLLSESEWEYVARAGSRSKYSFGDDADRLCEFGNVTDKTKSPEAQTWNEKANCSDGYWFTAPVGSFKANAWGVNDLHGNVWEWVEDIYQESYKGAPGDGSAWVDSGEYRVLRGGSWGSSPRFLRSALRDGDAAHLRSNLTGFRLAQDR